MEKREELVLESFFLFLLYKSRPRQFFLALLLEQIKLKKKQHVFMS